MANDSTNVGVGKPKVTGAIFVAPAGTTMPTDATTALPEAFKCLGYMSEDGLVIAEERDTDDISAWGGDVVRTLQTSYKETVTFTPIEINQDVMALEYGDDNVTVEEGSMVVRHTGADLPEKAVVIETVPNEKTVTRYAVPRAKLVEKGDLSLTDSDPIGRELSFTSLPDGTGATMYEYHAITGLSAAKAASALYNMTVPELERLAEDEGVDLSGAKTKSEKVAAIVGDGSDE